IPLCHPLPLTSVSVDFEFVSGGVRILTRARVVGPTGVEMEALTAAAVAGLTLIDMTKGVERGVYLETVRLLEKSGGRSGTGQRGWRNRIPRSGHAGTGARHPTPPRPYQTLSPDS